LEDTVERIYVPAREGRGARVRAGQRFRVVDMEGHQCADLFAFNAEDVREYASAEHTRVYNASLFPKVGEHFVTNSRRPILLFERDQTPGVHDMLVAACSPSRYQLLGVEGWHASCEENLEKAMADMGEPQVEIPQPINLFTNIPVHPDGSFEWQPALTKPGDYAEFRAELDCYVVVSSCPQDIVRINAGNPTPLELQILD
jgi:uncharacterized protein YcgI (DUF1989 family)